MQAPVASLQPRAITLHGEQLIDNYMWLQDKSDPAVIAYLEAENAYTEAAMAHTAAQREQLYHELRGRIKDADSSVPVRRGDYLYYTRVEAGQQHPIYCRRHASPTAPEEVLLDVNTLAEGLPFCKVGPFEPSPDQQLLAYAVDTTGAWVFDVYIKDLNSGTIVAGPIANTAWSLAWASDSRTLFYTTFDTAHRADKLWRYQIGTPTTAASLVYHEADEAFGIAIQRSRSGVYLLLNLASMSTSEVRYAPAANPEAAFAVITPRRPKVEYSVEHQGERFLIRTNWDAENFRLLAAPCADPAPEHWHELLPNRPEVLLDGIEAFAEYLVRYEREAGLRRIRICTPAGDLLHDVQFPEPVYTAQLGENPEYASHTLRLQYSSLVTPPSVIDYDMAHGSWQVRKQEEIPSGYDPGQYAAERLMATAPDGARVPISLVYRKGMQRDRSNPLLLYGYGAYGFSIEPGFDANRLSLLDRGFIFAIGHIRGGSDMGRTWYEQGRMLNKKNTFTDFIACAEHLIATGYTAPQRLAIAGRSAGGLLVSAVLNLRPELFGAAIAGVPFTNLLTAMNDPTLPLTVPEYEQWGNINDPVAYAYMRSYSPYEHVAAKAYPHLLITAGLTDLQVPYWDPAKWCAQLRARKTDNNLLLLKTAMEAGHSGPSGRYNRLKETAFEYAFLLEVLDVGSTAT